MSRDTARNTTIQLEERCQEFLPSEASSECKPLVKSSFLAITAMSCFLEHRQCGVSYEKENKHRFTFWITSHKFSARKKHTHTTQRKFLQYQNSFLSPSIRASTGVTVPLFWAGTNQGHWESRIKQRQTTSTFTFQSGTCHKASHHTQFLFLKLKPCHFDGSFFLFCLFYFKLLVLEKGSQITCNLVAISHSTRWPKFHLMFLKNMEV